jgi:hypothetical protein
VNGASRVKVVAEMLAREHANYDEHITEVYWAPHPREVRLVEVTSAIGDKSGMRTVFGT